VRRVPFSCFALPDAFSAAPRASGPVFMFCTPGLVFGGTEGVGSRFHVLRSLTRFRRYRGRRIPFSCFTLPNSFSAVPRASSLEFMFYAPRLILGGTEGVESSFHVLRSRTRFRRYRGRRVDFSCYALPDSFSTVPRALGPFFMFYAAELIFNDTEGVGFRFHVCAPGLVFGSTEGLGCCLHVLLSRTHFRRYRGPRVEFSCFALLNSFSPVGRVSGPVFMFCAPRLIFSGNEGVGSHFHVLRSRLVFGRSEGIASSCMFCAPGLVFGGSEGIGSRFYVLRSWTRFRRYRGRRV
jgi:hypothetical protein